VFSEYVLESLSDPKARRSASESTRQLHSKVSWGIGLERFKPLVFAETVFLLGCTKVYDIVANSDASFSHNKN